MADITVYKGKIAEEDLELGTSTFTRRDSSGADATLTQINVADLGGLERLEAWVDGSGNATQTIGTLRADTYVTKVSLDVTTAFDAGVTIDIGPSDDLTKYVRAHPIETGWTGYQEPGAHGEYGYNAASATIQANLNGSPSAGYALVVIEFYRVTTQPS